jgi:hypothetical protein
VIGLKRCIFILLLLSSQCFAETKQLEDNYYLYYVTSSTNETNLYYGKVLRGGVGTAFIEFNQLAVVKPNNCSGSSNQVLTCKINKFMQADKANRAALLDILVNKPIEYSNTPLVAIKLN